MKDTLTLEMLNSKLGNLAPFLISLSDGLQEELHITIAGAELGNLGGNIPDFEETDDATKRALTEMLSKARPIEVNEQCFYKICFRDYIIYQIRNESYASCSPEEIYPDQYVAIFEKSELLSRLSVVTDAQRLDDGSYYPGEWTHYGVFTQNHIIDVIALDPPEILEISGKSPNEG